MKIMYMYRRIKEGKEISAMANLIHERFSLRKSLTSYCDNMNTLINNNKEESNKLKKSKDLHDNAIGEILSSKVLKDEDDFLKSVLAQEFVLHKIDDKINKLLKKSTICEKMLYFSDILLKKDWEDTLISISKAVQNDMPVVFNYRDILKYKNVVIRGEQYMVKDERDRFSDMIVINKEGQILFLKRPISSSFEPGKWGLPGGHMLEDESPLEGAIRECLEETGLEIDSDLCIECGKYDSKGVHITYYFTCLNKHEIQIPYIDGEESVQYEWRSMKEIINSTDLIADLHSNLTNGVIKLPPIEDMREMFPFFDGVNLLVDEA